nr:acyl carrier protein [uncultured Roseateles sp.]
MSFESIFAEVFSIPESTVVDDLLLQNIASWDSLAHMMLITRLEDDFRVQLTGDEIADMGSVGDARLALRRHGAAV